MEDYFALLPKTDLVAPALVSASGNSAGVDLHGNIGSAILHLSAYNTAGTTPTLNAKLQDSPDDATWTDTPGAAFNQVAAGGSSQAISVNPQAVGRYVRVAYTIAGTNSPAYVLGVSVFTRPQVL